MTSTVDRVLPWRRSTPPPAEEVAPLLAEFRARHGRTVRTDLISRAYTASAAAHTGQMRKTGESYIHHPIAVARIAGPQSSHSSATEPDPAPISHRGSPARGASADSVIARLAK